MVEKFLRLRDVLTVSGLKRSAIYAGMSAGTFPKAVPIGPKAVGWVESEIEAWQKARIAARDCACKTAA